MNTSILIQPNIPTTLESLHDGVGIGKCKRVSSGIAMGKEVWSGMWVRECEVSVECMERGID